MAEIHTERLYLRNITENDAKDIYEYAKSTKVGSGAGWAPHESIKDTKIIIKNIFMTRPYIFGIVLPELNKVIGTISLVSDIKREYSNSLMLGYALSYEYWNNGYATEAAKAVIEYGFNTLNADIIAAYCYPFNKVSQHILDKLGFTLEGIQRMAELRYDGKIFDNYCYSLLKSEYLSS